MSGETRIAPGLLVAMPQLGDPNFERSVVLMVEHDEGGSLGVVLNRPTEVPVGVLLDGFGLGWSGDPLAVLGIGGPVMPQSGWLVHEPVAGLEQEPGTRLVAPGVALSVSEAALRRLAEQPPPRLRFLMGYAGWGPGQLRGELVAGAWLHAEVSPELVFEVAAGDLWLEAMRSIGVDPGQLASLPGLQ